MSSSTSSSDRARWGRAWVAALGLTVIALAGMELGWRRLGFEPSIDPEGLAWMVARESVGPESTVLVGTSRMQTNLDPRVWREEVGGDAPIQLSMVGTSPTPIVESLVDDPSFRGTIVYGVVPRFLFNPSPGAGLAGEQMVARYREAQTSPAAHVDRAVWRATAGRLVVQNPELRLGRLLEAGWSRRLPAEPRWRGRRDRFTPMDADLVPERSSDYEAYYRAVRPPTDAEIATRIARLRELGERLRARGGALIFVALPGCDVVPELEEAYFPRARFWDRFVDEVGAPTLRSYDHPELLEFTCADGSHLDFRDVPGFTRALASRVADLR